MMNMIDPYRMVFINIITSSLLFVGILFFRYVYPKRNINLFIVLILISLLPTISIARDGVYESGDFTIHVYRSIEFYRSLSEGNIMPSWAGRVNATYGLPLFIFNYTLPYYFISLFHFLGFSFVNSLKLFLASSFVLSVIFMFIFTKKLFKNGIAAFTSSIFYLFTPYHLIDLHFKIVIGELLAFTILPLLFYFVIKMYEDKQKVRSIIFTGVSFAALVASHVFIALAAVFIVIGYSVFISIKTNELKLNFKTSIALFIGTIISAYIWLPPFFMSQYTIIKKTKLNFVPLEDVTTLFYAPWRMGFLFQGPKGEIANLIGYTQWFVVLFFLYLLITRKIPQKMYSYVLFWLIIFGLLFFMVLPISKLTWEAVPFIKAVGQHRLLVLVALPTSILAGYFALINRKNKLLIYVLIITTLLYTILNWGQRRVIQDIKDMQLTQHIPLSTHKVDTHFYANSVWRDPQKPWFSKIPEQHLQIIKGEAKITEKRRLSTFHSYKVDAKTPVLLQENTLYFPGWNVHANGKSIKTYPSSEGVIRFSLPKGYYTVTVSYTDIPAYLFLKQLSISILYLTLFFIVFNSLYKRISHQHPDCRR